MQRTELNTLDISSKQSEDDTGVLKAKLETKKLRMRELKKQFENVCEENILIKNKLEELENFKQISEEKIQKFENETRQDHNEREREYIGIIKQLEHDKARADDKLNKLSSLDHIKSQEIELMNQKIKDFEIILDENTNDYLQQIKYYKDEIEKFRLRQVEQEKFCDVLNYFFTKISTVISPR